jgi:hypothetical protein
MSDSEPPPKPIEPPPAPQPEREPLSLAALGRNATGVSIVTTELVSGEVWSVGHECAGLGRGSVAPDGRTPCFRRELDQLRSVNIEERILDYVQRLGMCEPRSTNARINHLRNRVGRALASWGR